MEEDAEYYRLIDSLAKEEGVSYDTRYHWRVRGQVPHHWRLRLIMKAQNQGVNIPLRIFDDFNMTRMA